MGFIDELKRLARPYEDEEDDEYYEDDYEPVSRSDKSDRSERTGRSDRTERRDRSSMEGTGSIFPVERALKENFDDYGRKKERLNG